MARLTAPMQRTRAEHAAEQAGAARDAQLTAAHKKRAGVVHTPPELARFVARAADALVQSELGLAGGLGDARLALIDPACGPGAFLAAAAAVAGGRSSRPAALHGFDHDAPAIETARALIGDELRASGMACEFACRDTLVEVRPESIAMLAPATCVLGNPPWVASAQAPPSPWLAALLEDFRRDDAGVRLPERKLGVLSDAYVRFLRWACEVARCSTQGAVVAFVTNASYLDGPIHRGVRAFLRREFDRVHIVDLGGNALLARGSGRDDNVFGVRPAVAVALLVRRPNHTGTEPSALRYTRLCGSRADKLARLADAALGDLAVCELTPSAPFHRFLPAQPAHPAHDAYASWPSLADAMPFQREGVQTNRDAFVVDRDRTRLIERLRAFAAGANEAGEFSVASHALPHYAPERARAALHGVLERDVDGSRGLLVRPLAYRPFDVRWFAPIAPLCHRPRGELIAAIDASAFALLTARKDRGDLPWAQFAASRAVPDNCVLSSRSSCRARAFPTHDASGADNLSRAVADAFAERIGRAVTSVDFAHYALAVLASPHYRTRHDEALRIDYPRIPWPRDASAFEAWSARGRQLAELFCAPLLTGEHHLPPSAAALSLDRERGEVRIGSDVVVRVSQAALEFRFGHHRPLWDLARGDARHAWSRAELVALCARIETLTELIASLPDQFA